MLIDILALFLILFERKEGKRSHVN